MTAKLPGEDERIKVVVGNLRKKEKEDGGVGQKDVPFEIHVTSDCTLPELWRVLEEEHGYSPPDSLIQTRDDRVRRRSDLKSVFHPYTELEIVSDKSAADETHIYINEALQAASNRDQDVVFNIEYDGKGQNSLIIDDALQLVFHRTVRMPDDDRLHSLPASVGTFPLYNTEDYADRLPENILEKGGLFLPMWQREALWIELSRPKSSYTSRRSSQTYAIRVYVGQINAVSGKNMMEERANRQEQDYLVFPGQPWIDGICVTTGVVRQFVAMPLGSGYTVEGQKTGEEKHGGLQIEIIPAYRKKAQKWRAAAEEEEEALQDPRLYLDESKTPAELGLEAGSKVWVYPSPPTYRKPVEVGDLYWVREESGLGVANLEAFYDDYRRSASTFMGSRSRAMGDSHDLARPTWFNGTLAGSGVNPGGAPSLNQQCTAAATASLSLSDAYLGDPDSPRMAPPPSKARKGRARPMGHPRNSSKPESSPRQVLNVKAMGLAAGGKLVQDIIADRNPPNTWNVDAARQINIHILDPASCESVTHIVPPPIPMSAYEAVLSKLPFFVVEEQIDNRLEGGDFDNVKSVSKMDETKGLVSEPSLDPNQPTICSSLFDLAIINFATCAYEQQHQLWKALFQVLHVALVAMQRFLEWLGLLRL
ncbi:hypothetical protein PEBR_40658 [Penicillium brasilianum]|uniref:Uncharacterized protein n=1 Tax=Penicillium brasilianum TaxID=104259 RepID=A0A1S9R9C4_PENBI|nr:hypothetical protein PEBR_40658 [Penicillium brasilianum]